MTTMSLDRSFYSGELHLKDELAPRYAELIYNGMWFSPEREALQAAIDKTQEFCTGEHRRLCSVSVSSYDARINKYH